MNVSTRHLDLALGAPVRLRILKREYDKAVKGWTHCDAETLATRSWRTVRYATFNSDLGLFQGDNNIVRKTGPVWYTHHDAGWREKAVHDVPEWERYTGRDSHTGWFTHHEGYTSKDGSGLAWGLVVMLPHGRYLAGYQWGDNDERVYFADIYDDLREACIAADAHAQRFAEALQEDSLRYETMVNLEALVTEHEKELRRLVALRNHPVGDRDETRDLIAMLRKTREEYDEAVNAYAKGE